MEDKLSRRTLLEVSGGIATALAGCFSNQDSAQKVIGGGGGTVQNMQNMDTSALYDQLYREPTKSDLPEPDTYPKIAITNEGRFENTKDTDGWQKVPLGTQSNPVPNTSHFDGIKAERIFGDSLPYDGAVYIAGNGDYVGINTRTGEKFTHSSDVGALLNNLIDSLPSEGQSNVRHGLIQIAEGFYRLSTTIQLYGGTKLRGAGIGVDYVGTIIKASDSFTGNGIEVGPFSNNVYGWSVQHLMLDGNRQNTSSGHGFVADVGTDGGSSDEPRDGFIQWFWPFDWGGNGVWLQESHGTEVANSLSEANGNHGWVSDGYEAEFSNVFSLINDGRGFVVKSQKGKYDIKARGNAKAGVWTGGNSLEGRILAFNNGTDDTSTYPNVEMSCSDSVFQVLASANVTGQDGSGIKFTGNHNTVTALCRDNGGYGVDFGTATGNTVVLGRPSSGSANGKGLYNDPNYDNVVIGPQASFVKAVSTANQSISSNTWTTLALDTANRDALGEFDSTNYQFTPGTTGWYDISGSARFAIGADGDLIQIRLRDVTANTVHAMAEREVGGGGTQTLDFSTSVELTGGNAHEVEVRNQNSADTVYGNPFGTYLRTHKTE